MERKVLANRIWVRTLGDTGSSCKGGHFRVEARRGEVWKMV